MREESHRASRRCYRSGSQTFLRYHARRLDGYSLYSARHVWIRAQSEADRGRLRHAARQFGRRGGAAEESRYPVAGDEAFGGLRGGWAPAGQGAASDAGTGAATSVRARVWLCRLQRRRAAGRRCDPQAAGRPRSDRRAGLGLAADAVAVRERGRMGTVARHGARPGRHRDRDPAAAAQGPGHPDHDRPGSHRRPDPRPAGVHVLQRPLRYVVLPADRRDRDLQRRGRAVRRGGGAAAGQRARHAGGAGDPAALAREAARGLSQGHGPGAAGRRVCPPEAVHVPRAAAGRVRRGDGEQPAAGEAGPPLDGQGPDALQGHRPDDPETVYQFYCGRGDVENRLKELHHGLELDRTSCERFLANQFRVLLTLAAYVLFQELRRRAAGTPCADAQVTTLRERLLKLAVWVERSVRRIVLHFPATFPWLPTWQRIARAVGATP